MITDPTSPRRLLLVRHGRTAWNASGRIQGQLDAELDDLGQAQAREVAPVVAKHDPQLLWCSDLARARATAEQIATASGLSLRSDARLREYALGSFEDLTHAEAAEVDAAAQARMMRGDFDGVPEGERAPQVGERMVAALQELLAATDPGRVSVAVSHGAALRVGVAVMCGWPLEVARTLGPLGNCSMVVLREVTERQPGEPAMLLEAYNLAAGAS